MEVTCHDKGLVIRFAGRSASSASTRASATAFVSDRGVVALAAFLCCRRAFRDSTLDRDPLIAKVVACFTAIGAKDVEALARTVGEDDG
jgi:hypothetical protein